MEKEAYEKTIEELVKEKDHLTTLCLELNDLALKYPKIGVDEIIMEIREEINNINKDIKNL